MSKNDPSLPKYFNKTKDFIKMFEGFSKEKTKDDGIAFPYYDSKGIPHIGYGFNLMVSDVCDDVVREILDEKHKENNPFDTHQPSFFGFLKILFNGNLDGTKIHIPSFKEKSDVDKISNIIFASLKTKQEGENDEKLQTQIQERFDDLLHFHHSFSITKEQAEKILEKRLKEIYIPQLDASLTRSKRLSQNQLKEFKEREEYVALLSLAYINVGTLIGAGLCSGLKNNNRFKAWFEIRYNSNLEKNIGIAKRRFAESNVFGLFENTKRGEEYKNTIQWGENEADLKETMRFFSFLHSKFEKEGKKNYFEYIKYYENNYNFSYTTFNKEREKIKKTTPIFKKWELETNGEIAPDLKYHYLPYAKVFSPFVKTFNEAMKEANCLYRFDLENILVVNQNNNISIVETINEKSAKGELAIILEKGAGLGFFRYEIFKIQNPNKLHIILSFDNHIDCLGFKYPQKLAFYTLEDDKIKKLKGCDNPLIHQSFSFRDMTISGLAQYDTNGRHIHCFKSLFDNRCSPNLSVYDKKTLKLIATIYNLRSEEDSNA